MRLSSTEINRLCKRANYQMELYRRTKSHRSSFAAPAEIVYIVDHYCSALPSFHDPHKQRFPQQNPYSVKQIEFIFTNIAVSFQSFTFFF